MVTNPLEIYLQQLINEGCKRIQIGLRGMSQPIGPAKVEHLSLPVHTGAAISTDRVDLYKVVTQARFPKPSPIPGMPPTAVDVLMPMVIGPADIVFVSSGPTHLDGKPLDMGGDEPKPKKSPSGIEIA